MCWPSLLEMLQAKWNQGHMMALGILNFSDIIFVSISQIVMEWNEFLAYLGIFWQTFRDNIIADHKIYWIQHRVWSLILSSHHWRLWCWKWCWNWCWEQCSPVNRRTKIVFKNDSSVTKTFWWNFRLFIFTIIAGLTNMPIRGVEFFSVFIRLQILVESTTEAENSKPL